MLKAGKEISHQPFMVVTGTRVLLLNLNQPIDKYALAGTKTHHSCGLRSMCSQSCG